MSIDTNGKPVRTTVQLPCPLCALIEQFIIEHEELGYDDVEDFILNAVRDKVEYYSIKSDTIDKIRLKG